MYLQSLASFSPPPPCAHSAPNWTPSLVKKGEGFLGRLSLVCTDKVDFQFLQSKKNPIFFSRVLRRLRPGRSGEDPALTIRYDLFNRFLHSCRFVCSKIKFQIPPDFDDATGGEIEFGRAVMVRKERLSRIFKSSFFFQLREIVKT